MGETADMVAAEDGSEQPILSLRGIWKRFGAITALSGIELDVPRVGLTAIVGDNGAGKSTLMKIVSGLYAPTDGRIVIDGMPVSMSGPEDARAHGIEVVYQDLALASSQPVYMNVFLGREITRFGVLDKARMREESREVLGRLKINIPSVDASVDKLSGGQRQGIAISRAVKWASSLILMDEPTAALGVAESDRVENTILTLKEHGVAVLLVSHNMDQVFRLADRIAVLRRGQLVGVRDREASSVDEIVSLITGSSHLTRG